MHERHLRVHCLPSHLPAEGLAGSAVIVIDVLRATSTICQALASGAKEVVPFLEIDEALAAAAKADRRDIVLGGELGQQDLTELERQSGKPRRGQLLGADLQ